MKLSIRSLRIASVPVLAGLCLYGGTVRAQSVQQHDHAGHDHASHGNHDHSGETIAFRLKETKELHFEDAAKAQQHVQTLKRLGCEVRQSGHAGHIDVIYRCTEWKTTEFTTHELAEQWDEWLKSSGFDVSHPHKKS